MSQHRFPYRWTMKDASFTKDKGTVFSCFSCGGGSSFGYKLAGFDVIGCNDIDEKMMDIYIKNHQPRYSYLGPIQDFKSRNDLPDDMYQLDILDGSPPCSSFSMAGNREDDWGVEKKFREGQATQVLDTLFFDFIDLAKKLKPKVVIAENVKGLLLGDAKKYVRRIYDEFDDAGYHAQHWLLDASKMGVPQRRERVFFIALRKDLASQFMKRKDLFTYAPELVMEFDESPIPFRECECDNSTNGKPMSPGMMQYYDLCRKGDNMSTVCPKGKNYWFNYSRLHEDEVAPTLVSSNADKLFHYDRPEQLSLEQWCILGSFPTDYDFMDDGKRKNDGRYVVGMSVPPVMVANVAAQVYEQWLSKLKTQTTKTITT